MAGGDSASSAEVTPASMAAETAATALSFILPVGFIRVIDTGVDMGWDGCGNAQRRGEDV